MEADGFAIEPAGNVEEGAGHFHLMVDADCVASGQQIPTDDAHRHLADGATRTQLDLPSGEHTLCLQAGNGAHEALDLTHEITITVGESRAATTDDEGEADEDEVWEGSMNQIVTSVPATGGRCGSRISLTGVVRLVVLDDDTVRGTYDVEGPCVSEPHAEFTGRVDNRAFYFPQLIVQTNGEPIPKVSETQARATLTNFQGAGGVGARWVTTWNLRCTTC
jgi:Domain of unknown function (DUF4399)